MRQKSSGRAPASTSANVKARFEADLWELGRWVMMRLPVDLSEQISSVPRPPEPGFGSIRVSVTIGATVWATSIFPDSKTATYVLPVKKAVRVAEGLEVGDVTRVELEVLG